MIRIINKTIFYLFPKNELLTLKTFFFKDEVAVDQQFEQQKIETKQEAKKELEELEGLE